MPHLVAPLAEETGSPRRMTRIPFDSDTEPATHGKSVFDGELPDLDELKLEPESPRARRKMAAASPHMDELDDLDGLVPDPAGAERLAPLGEDDALAHEDYRVICRVCGTAQYVSPSAKGMKIKCPDCFSDFKVPPPPAGWKPNAKKKALPVSADFGYVPVPSEELDTSQARRKERTLEMLEKAKVEITQEDDHRLYDGDFDTAGFVQGTFGFLRDPLTLAQVAVYGLVFGILAALIQFSLNDLQSEFGRGLLLITAI
jgi:hypothetical protein